MDGRGATGITAVLGIVAVALTAGFLGWLYYRAQTYEPPVPVVMEDTAGAGAEPVGLAELAADPAAVAGRRAALDTVPVANRLGRGVFTLRLNGVEYPVELSRDLLMREDLQIYGGDRVAIRGRFFPLNEDRRTDWVEQGAVDEANRGGIPRTATFLLADSLGIH